MVARLLWLQSWNRIMTADPSKLRKESTVALATTTISVHRWLISILFLRIHF